ncbi:MAG: flagellar hook-basal body complex protein FliE [Clostridiales bacterium]|jgi:flagellar hook-basal body complex protein FliE|nr:flagellar hook-basal body complex protein FliE [Clostridiales bacterium]
MDAINGLGRINELGFYKPVKETAEVNKSAFEGFFQAALNALDGANEAQLNSEKLYLDLATGKTDDVLAVILAQEKATASLNFTVQITNKVIEAYREIMRMQM